MGGRKTGGCVEREISRLVEVFSSPIYIDLVHGVSGSLRNDSPVTFWRYLTGSGFIVIIIQSLNTKRVRAFKLQASIAEFSCTTKPALRIWDENGRRCRPLEVRAACLPVTCVSTYTDSTIAQAAGCHPFTARGRSPRPVPMAER